MTMVTLNAVGLCAHFSPVGDRAFRYALSLARRQGIRLNVFSFLQSPYESPPSEGKALSDQDPGRQLAAKDLELRLYYEDRLGDYLDVGFRVCEGRETVELRRCLVRREYEVLVVPYLDRGAVFGAVPVEEFAHRFVSPVVLVGPWRRVRYYLNSPAVLIAEKLGLYEGSWRALHSVTRRCPTR